MKDCENCHVFNFKIMDVSKRPPKTLGSCNYYTNQKDKSKCAGVQIHILREQLLAEQAKNKKLVEALERIENCWNNIDSDKFAGHRLYITLQQALNEVNKC